MPADLEPIMVEWEAVGDENGLLNPDHQVKAYLEGLMYEEHPSEYQGTIGMRLQLDVTVVRTYEGSNYYGRYMIHTMEDEMGNQYVWSTAAKSWPEGSKKTIVGTVKEFKTYRNIKQTVLTRCKEV